MYLSIDPKSSVPLYAQIKEQMRLAVSSGGLQPGDQLPTVRELATRLRLNPNTVARAYRELQADGLLTSRQGSGTFVSAEAPAVAGGEARAFVSQMLSQAITTALNLGLTRAQITKLFTDSLRETAREAAEDDGGRHV
jgi:GntR family transcriptional regulator